MPKMIVNKEKVLEDLKSGEKTMAQIAREQGVTHQRIKQIADQHGIPAHHIKVMKRQEKAAAKYKGKWGEARLYGSDLYDAQRQKFRQKKAQSKAEWTIQFGDIDWPSHCPILGLELDYFTPVRQENSPSFDRTDPAKGYVPGNVQILSWRANRIKNDGSAEEHRKIAEYLGKHIF